MGSESECATCGNDYSALDQHYYSTPSHKPDDWPECPSCGERYNHLGVHWYHSDCKYPSLTQYQYEIVVGLMMGDGGINYADKNSCFRCSMITKEYLEWVDNVFGILGTGVRLQKSAKESVEKHKESGFNEGAKVNNYSDLYVWKTRNLPVLDEFAAWYDTGSIMWPEDINLTPTVLKHWYVSDGRYNNNSGSNYISIGTSNEIENKKKINNYFKKVSLPRPNRWGNYSMVWKVDESYELCEYMLEDGHGIPPGFEYKWPEEFH